MPQVVTWKSGSSICALATAGERVTKIIIHCEIVYDQYWGYQVPETTTYNIFQY